MFSEDDAIRGLTLAVRKYGVDHVDPNAEYGICKNVYQDEEGNTGRCIAAEALFQLGVSDETLRKFNNDSVDRLTRGNSGQLVDIGFDAVDILLSAQGTQDAGHCWGDAHLDAALAYAELTGAL